MSAFLLPVVLASLAGSLHCAAMCGPFMAAVSGIGGGGRTEHAAYHAGRLVTYLALGAAAGLLGSGLDVAGSHAGFSRTSAVVAGVVLVVSGASALFAREQLVRLGRRAPWRFGSWLGLVLARVKRSRPTPRAFLLGLSTTLVPCGWLYAFVATAAGTGRVVSALGVMLAFWLGTLPALLVAGAGLQRITARLGERARVLSGSLIILSGVVLLGLRAGAPAELVTKTEAPASMPASCPLHGH